MGMIIEVAKQIPALAVLVWLVILFLGHLREERDSRVSIESARHEALKEIGDGCHAHSMKIANTMSDALKDSNAIVRENTQVISQVSTTLQAIHMRQELTATNSSHGRPYDDNGS